MYFCKENDANTKVKTKETKYYLTKTNNVCKPNLRPYGLHCCLPSR
jgi:hypothetical protein